MKFARPINHLHISRIFSTFIVRMIFSFQRPCGGKTFVPTPSFLETFRKGGWSSFFVFPITLYRTEFRFSVGIFEENIPTVITFMLNSIVVFWFSTNKSNFCILCNFRMPDFRMHSVRSTNLKILWIIIFRFTVFMVDYFIRFQISIKLLLHNYPMLRDIPAFLRERMIFYKNIPIGTPFYSSTFVLRMLCRIRIIKFKLFANFPFSLNRHIWHYYYLPF